MVASNHHGLLRKRPQIQAIRVVGALATKSAQVVCQNREPPGPVNLRNE